MLFRRGRLSVGSKQGDVTLYYQPFCDGEALMGRSGAPSRIYGLVAVNECPTLDAVMQRQGWGAHCCGRRGTARRKGGPPVW